MYFARCPVDLEERPLAVSDENDQGFFLPLTAPLEHTLPYCSSFSEATRPPAVGPDLVGEDGRILDES